MIDQSIIDLIEKMWPERYSDQVDMVLELLTEQLELPIDEDRRQSVLQIIEMLKQRRNPN